MTKVVLSLSLSYKITAERSATINTIIKGVVDGKVEMAAYIARASPSGIPKKCVKNGTIFRFSPSNNK